jgi:hypothetical protein
MKRQAATHPIALHHCPSLRYLCQVASRYEHLPATQVFAAPSPPSRPDAGVNGLVLFARSAQRPKASPLSMQRRTLRHFLRQVKKEIGDVSGETRPDFEALDALIDSSRRGLPRIDQLTAPARDLRRFVKSLDSRKEAEVVDTEPASDPVSEEDMADAPQANDDGQLPAEGGIERHMPILPVPLSLEAVELTEAFPHSKLFQPQEDQGRRANRARLVTVFMDQLAQPTRHLALGGVSAHALDQSMKDGTFAAFVKRRQEMSPAIDQITLPAQLETSRPPCLSYFVDTVTAIRFPRPEMPSLDLTHLPHLKMIKLYAPLHDDLAACTSRPAACHVRTIYED